MGIVGVLRVPLVHSALTGVRLVLSGGHWGSLGSFGFIWFIRARPRCCWVYSGSFGSIGHSMGVVGFIQDRLVDSGTLWVSLGLFVFVWFFPAHPGSCLVHSDVP